MKKLLFVPVILVSLFFTNCKDSKKEEIKEFIASTEVENRKAVLAHFEGVRCFYCPEGYRIAADLESSNGEDFVSISVNSGAYANPIDGWANFTTPYGDALIGQTVNETFKITNTGCDTLKVTNILSSLPIFESNISSFELLPAGQIEVVVSFTPVAIGIALPWIPCKP